MGYVGAQDDLCELGRWVSRLFKVTKAEKATVTYISSSLTEMCPSFKVGNKNLANKLRYISHSVLQYENNILEQKL